jgi:hypothetical protein
VIVVDDSLIVDDEVMVVAVADTEVLVLSIFRVLDTVEYTDEEVV